MAKVKKAAAKPKKAAAVKKDRKPAKKDRVIELYKQGKLAPEIIKLTGFKKNTVEGAINHFRNAEGLANSGKVYKDGKLIDKPKAEKKAKAAPVKKAKKVSTQKKEKPVKNNGTTGPVSKPGAGTRVVEIPEDKEPVEEIEVDENTGKPLTTKKPKF